LGPALYVVGVDWWQDMLLHKLAWWQYLLRFFTQCVFTKIPMLATVIYYFFVVQQTGLGVTGFVSLGTSGGSFLLILFQAGQQWHSQRKKRFGSGASSDMTSNNQSRLARSVTIALELTLGVSDPVAHMDSSGMTANSLGEMGITDASGAPPADTRKKQSILDDLSDVVYRTVGDAELGKNAVDADANVVSDSATFEDSAYSTAGKLCTLVSNTNGTLSSQSISPATQPFSPTSSLPVGWEVVIVEDGSDHYYYHTESGVVQWERPEH
jgi:hypothetical protein